MKYLKPKRSVASAITVFSIVGVMIGIAAVICVRSVMMGFCDIWERKIVDFKPHITLIAPTGPVVHGEEEIAEKLRKVPGVVSVTPTINTRVMLAYRGRVLAPVMIGVDADEFTKAYNVGEPCEGTFNLDGDSIVIGRHVARQLGVWVGDEVTVYSPKTLVSKDEVFLPVKWKVAGIFSCGQYDYDSGYVVASLPNVRDIMGMEKGVLAIHVKTDCPTQEERFNAIVDATRETGLTAMTWRQADREIFSALAVEKNMTAVLMLLISLVAIFCVMITLLVMTVQKTPEIGLLKALGFSRRQIMGVFMTHGLIQCSAGVVMGLLASWAILSNLQNIVEFLAKFGVTVFPESVYGLPEIPHRLIFSDVAWAVVFVFVFGVLASFIPALLAAAKDPVKALDE